MRRFVLFLTCLIAIVVALAARYAVTSPDPQATGVLLLALVCMFSAGMLMALTWLAREDWRPTSANTTRTKRSKRSKGHTEPWGNAWARLRHDNSKGYQGQPIQGALGHPRG